MKSTVDVTEALEYPKFGVNEYIITLEWIQDNSLSYNVSVSPRASISFTNNSSIQLNLSYNTLYDVRVLATTTIPCRVSPATVATVQLHYGRMLL